jgi:AP-1 complex subunit mu
MSRNYRGDIDVGCIEKFMPLLMEQEDEGRSSPVIHRDGLSYIHIKHMNIYRQLFMEFFNGF